MLKCVSRLFLLLIGCLCWFAPRTISAKETWKDLQAHPNWQPIHDIAAIADASPGFTFTAAGADPYIQTATLAFPAPKFAALEIEMSISGGSQGQVFWTTDADPTITESKSRRFPLIPDNQFHTYTISLFKHPQWQGNILQLRFDPTDAQATGIVRSFRVVDRLGPNVQLISFNPQRPFALPNEELSLSAHVRNDGDATGTIQVTMHFPKGVALDQEKNLQRQATIPPDSEQEVSWKFQSPQEGVLNVTCEWKPLDFAQAVPPAETVLYNVIQIADVKNPKETITLEDEQSCAAVMRTEMGYGPIHFFVKKNNELKDAAWMPRLSTIYVLLKDGTVQSWPIFSGMAEHRGSGNLVFRRSWEDRDGRKWDFELNLRKLTDLPGAFGFTYQLAGDGGRLLHFSGPELYIGERSFGGQKDLAVFPGVEYLDKNVVSSSDAVAHPPVRDEYVPNIGKVTIPFMSLTWDGMLVSLLWPPNAVWARDERGLSPKFAVPNRFNNQENNLMGLFIPTVPKYTRENRDKDNQPYEIQPGEMIRIESVVYLIRSADPNDAVSAWTALYNRNTLPEPIKPPRSYEEEIILSRQAYLTSCWNEAAQGWGHCVGWAPVSSGGMLALLALDEFLSANPKDKEILHARIEGVKKKILETQGPAGLGEPAGCHVMTMEPAFFWGVVEAKLPQWHAHALAMTQSRNAEGVWGFNPANEDQKTLGKPGEVVSGTISPNTQFLLRLARITGDATATVSGLKALDVLNQQSVPRGAQGWECPIAAPDILVSGQALRANLDAYRITGEARYLEKARYWARSGMVFHYFWNMENRPLQRYATIPIFGTTFFTHSWRGVPVQWCGLVYAYSLIELAGIDNHPAWLTLARGIVNSAMLQQIKEGVNIGTLPDSYGDYFLTARGAFINPENIMTNLHALEGNSLNIRTVFPDKPSPQGLRISANADISDATSVDKTVQFTLSSKPDRLTEALIAPLPQAATAVILDGTQPLNKVETLFGNDFGWKYLPDFQTALIHVKPPADKVRIKIQY